MCPRFQGNPAEELLTVAATGQEDEAFQVLTQLGQAVGGVADELFQRYGEVGRVTGEPAIEELQHFGEFGGGVELDVGMGITALSG